MKNMPAHSAYPASAGPNSSFPLSRGSRHAGADSVGSDVGGIVVDSSDVVGMVSSIGVSADPTTSPAPLFGRVRAAQQAHHLPIEFGGTGGEYFRIWIVNLLLTLLTLGLYYPWAKVRKLRWFYGHTQLAGHAFDFHGEPKKMLRGTLLAGLLVLAYSVAGELSAFAGLVAAVIVASLWPLLLRSALQFRLANTSWCGLRFNFSGSAREAYAAVAPPLLLFLLPATLAAFHEADMGLAPDTLQTLDVVVLGAAVLMLLGLPYFMWRLKRYQHSHFRLGQLRTEWKGELRAVYVLCLRTFGLVLLPIALIGAGIAGILAGGSFGAGVLLLPLMFALLLAGMVVMYVVAPAYFTVRMQNLAWTKTGNRYMRLRSQLELGPYIKLQLVNWLLVMFSMGFYWPWAVVSTRRMRLAAITVVSRVEPEELAMAVRPKAGDAAADMGEDLFGLDFGW
jgi:uncharacterized membrane protein YjgN (DUF898 family)